MLESANRSQRNVLQDLEVYEGLRRATHSQSPIVVRYDTAVPAAVNKARPPPPPLPHEKNDPPCCRADRVRASPVSPRGVYQKTIPSPTGRPNPRYLERRRLLPTSERT